METYVIQTETGNEQYAKALLETITPLRGFYSRAWIPEKNYFFIKKVDGERTKTLERKILFPGYLFLDAEDQSALIDGFRNIHLDTFFNLLGKQEGVLRSVLPQELEFIHRISHSKISTGAIINKKIQFISGPFVGLEGFVRKADRHKLRVQLAVPFLGEERLVWVACDQISLPPAG